MPPTIVTLQAKPAVVAAFVTQLDAAAPCAVKIANCYMIQAVRRSCKIRTMSQIQRTPRWPLLLGGANAIQDLERIGSALTGDHGQSGFRTQTVQTVCARSSDRRVLPRPAKPNRRAKPAACPQTGQAASALKTYGAAAHPDRSRGQVPCAAPHNPEQRSDNPPAAPSAGDTLPVSNHEHAPDGALTS